jgi:hypothetical protein
LLKSKPPARDLSKLACLNHMTRSLFTLQILHAFRRSAAQLPRQVLNYFSFRTISAFYTQLSPSLLNPTTRSTHASMADRTLHLNPSPTASSLNSREEQRRTEVSTTLSQAFATLPILTRCQSYAGSIAAIVRSAFRSAVEVFSPHDLPSPPREPMATTSDAAEHPSFPRFGKLPREIRLVVWEEAIPGPRIVELAEKPLKLLTAGFMEQKEHYLHETLHCYKGADPKREEVIFNQRSREECAGVRTTPFSPMTGLQSVCVAPAILFACRESHEVAIRHYKQTFGRVAQRPETWFDFHKDILYIRCVNFQSPRRLVADGYNDWWEKLRSLLHPIDASRVEHLALAMPQPYFVRDHSIRQCGWRCVFF